MPEETVVPAADTRSPEMAEFENTAIPEFYKDSPIAKYQTIGEAFKGYGEAQKLIGAKGAIIPGDKAEQAEWDKFFNSIGRPEKPEGYKLSPVENLHPELKITPEVEAGFKSLAHRHGLTGKQADGLYKEYFGMISGSLTKRDEKMLSGKHAAETALRTEWGADYDSNASKAKRLVEKFGGANAREAFGELGNNPIVLKTLANIASKFSEDGFIKGETVTNAETKEAQQKITEIENNKDHPYFNRSAPGHDEAVKEVMRLRSIVHPEVEA